MKKLLSLGFLLAALLIFGSAEAEETKLIVRAKSKDAKFVGTSMGGARVVIKDAHTGKILSEGDTSGATGNTNIIMIEPWQRGARLTDDYTAKFETTIDINDPTLLTIEVEAPNVQKPNTIKSMTQVWLIPGKDIIGDGVIVEVPGFSVKSHVPSTLALSTKKTAIPIRANIVMI